MALLSRPRPQRAGRGEGFQCAALYGLTEQALEQRHEDDANQGDTAARHKLFHALRFYLYAIKK